MMTFKTRRVTGGVDTHGDVHVAVAVDSVSHRRLGVEAFPASTAGYVELLAWFCSFGELDPVGVESTGSYGAGLTRFLVRQGVSVVEVNCPDRRARRFNGKDDPTDAEAAARAVLAGTATAIPKSGDGPVEAIRALEITYHSASKDRTRAINQFKALLVSAPAALREHLQQHSFHRQLQLARRFHDHHDDLTTQELRWALKELARRIGFLDDQLGRLNTRINTIAADTAPALIGMPGVGPHVAAQLLAAAGDNPDRMRSEAAFAKLCGACPIPASSGKTTRHRLNPYGDRRANNALFTIVLVRMRHHAPTRAYVARRTAEGLSRKEIMRCLKRFVAREVFHALTNPTDDLPTGHQLRALRTARALNLTQVSNALGIAQITLSRLERGISHDTPLARRTRDWLLDQPAELAT
jgi:transposase